MTEGPDSRARATLLECLRCGGIPYLARPDAQTEWSRRHWVEVIEPMAAEGLVIIGPRSEYGWHQITLKAVADANP